MADLRRRMVMSILMIISTVSCKTKNSDSLSASVNRTDLLQSQADSASTAVLILGGFTSCGYKSGQNFPDDVDPITTPEGASLGSLAQWVSKMVKAHRGSHKFLLSCYPFWTNFGPNLDTMLKSLSGIPRPQGHLAQTTFSNSIYFRHSLAGPTTPTLRENLGNFLAKLGPLLDQNGIQKVAIIGHSFGGYTAIQAAKHLVNGNHKVQLSLLVTLDPISMNQCLPEVFSKGIQAKNGLPGCTNAPGINMNDATINKSDMEKIASKVPWFNYWQGVDRYLHSSPIDIGDIQNIEIVHNRTNTEGIGNHVFYSFPDDRNNPQWPKTSDEIIEKLHQSLVGTR